MKPSADFGESGGDGGSETCRRGAQSLGRPLIVDVRLDLVEIMLDLIDVRRDFVQIMLDLIDIMLDLVEIRLHIVDGRPPVVAAGSRKSGTTEGRGDGAGPWFV